MKPIVINYKNRERIEKALEEVQGRAKERTVNFFSILSAPLIINETGKRYISEKDFLEKYMGKHYQKFHRNFKF